MSADLPYSRTELMIALLAREVTGLGHVVAGALSPLPAAAALLAQASGPTRATVLGSRRFNPFGEGGRELFDCAAEGRIDAFFLSGGQIDGEANINLVEVGDPAHPRCAFPAPSVRPISISWYRRSCCSARSIAGAAWCGG